MWGFFVGLGIGALQVFALRALIRMIMGTQMALGALLLLLKITAVVALLWLISTVSLTHLIWAAGGMFAGLVLGLVIVQWKQKRAGEHGKDDQDV
jgi:hypothetical protein